MAKPVSEEELQLKKRARRRLIGAIVLVASVAVVLPMVLDSDPKPTSQEINIQIPSPDSTGFASKIVPIPAPPAKGAMDGKSDAKAAAKASGSAEKPLPTAPEPAKEAAVVEKPATKPVREKPVAKVPEKANEKAAEKAAPKPGTFFIQVTALADADRAKQVQQRITDVGFPSYTQLVVAGKGSVTRVRAGPFATRDEAENAREKLQAAGLEGKVAGN